MIISISKIQILYRIISTLPSRIIFGNCIPFLKNFLPLLSFYNFKKIFYKKNLLDKEGYVKIPYNIDPNIIREIKEQFDKDIVNSETSYFETERSKKKILLKYPLNIKGIDKISILFDLFLKKYFDGNYKVIKVSGWRTHYDPSKDEGHEKYIYSNYWHYDHYRTDILKIFILLNNKTTKDNGSTKIINIKNSNFLSRTLKFLDTSISNSNLNDYLKINDKMLINCDGNLGDIYIVNTAKCLHSASIPSKNMHRDIIQIEVTKNFNNNQKPFEEILNKNESF